MFWCVADFSVRPPGQMLGIVLWHGVRHHALTLMIATWHLNSCSGLQSVDGC